MPEPPQRLQLIDILRNATRQHHQAIELRLAQTGESWTPARYARFLSMTYAVVAPLEAALSDRLGGLFAAPPPATRVERLEADLAAMGRAVAPAPERRLASAAEALGVGYVLQGSLLGGAIIARQVRAGCGSSTVQTSYLEMYGSSLGSAWSEYCAAVNAFGARAGEAARERSVAAAVGTFAAYNAALDAG